VENKNFILAIRKMIGAVGDEEVHGGLSYDAMTLNS
jgi:hypothetical protein